MQCVIDALQFLLSCGADPNINGEVANAPSALHFAVSDNHTECVELLIQNGANINAIMLSDEVGVAYCTHIHAPMSA